MGGFEADDVIGTAQKWTALGPERNKVVTADKDIMQLVGDQISMWDGKEKETDRAGVIEKFGVPPERVVDVLPRRRSVRQHSGVPGIGIKTAATLLATYDSMAELLERADEVKGKRGENLRSFKEQALLSYELATIVKLDVPVELDEAALQSSEPDLNELADFCRELNFKRFLKEFDLEDHAVAKVSVDRSAYQTILSLDSLETTVRQ